MILNDNLGAMVYISQITNVAVMTAGSHLLLIFIKQRFLFGCGKKYHNENITVYLLDEFVDISTHLTSLLCYVLVAATEK